MHHREHRRRSADHGLRHAQGGRAGLCGKAQPQEPETVDGELLKQMNQRGEISGCIVEGPISYDCAMSKEIADFKGYQSPCAGDCDVLLAPNIHAGNIMGKMLTGHLRRQDGRIHRGRQMPHRHDQPRLLRRGEVPVHRHLRRGRPESIRRNPNGATFDSQPRLYVHQAGRL